MENLREKDTNNPPLGVWGGKSKRANFLWRVPNLVHFVWWFQEKGLSLPKNKIMAVLNFTSREFRSQQAHVFDLADRGEKVIIRRNRKQAYTLVPIEDDDLTITPELQARIDKARAEIKAGNCVTLKSHADIDAYFDSL